MSDFGLLCWNLHKRGLEYAPFARFWEELSLRHGIDIAALQEARLPEGALLPAPWERYRAAAGPNLRLWRFRYGVLTLSALPMAGADPYLSRTREIGVATRKSALLTRHRVDGVELTLLNLHLVNFVPHRLFARELAHIAAMAAKREGALVVAGDFNTWSRRRLASLESAMAHLGLEPLEVTEPHHLKRAFGHALDRIYFRGLEPLAAKALPGPFSDHNPIWARFSLVSPESRG
ncbi:endonuclease/exonuclease/phosphatase family protein [Hydrogenimonas sp.]